MLESKKWTFRPWKQVLETQLGSWMLYIPGMSNTSEVKEIKKLKGIVFFVLEILLYS